MNTVIFERLVKNYVPRAEVFYTANDSVVVVKIHAKVNRESILNMRHIMRLFGYKRDFSYTSEYARGVYTIVFVEN